MNQQHKPSTSYHHGDLKNQLLLAALCAVKAEGVESISVRALARGIGVTHRAAYVHFKTKDMLISTVVAYAYDQLTQYYQEAKVSHLSPDSSLVEIANIYAKFAMDNSNLFLAMIGPRMNTNGQYPELERSLQRAWQFIQTPIDKGIKSGFFSCTSDAGAVFFWGGLQGILSQYVLGRIKISPDQRLPFFQKSTLMLIKGMRA